MSSSRTRDHEGGNGKKTNAELVQELKDLQDKIDFLTSELGRKDELLDNLKANNEKSTKANEMLEESDAKYRTLFDSIDQGFCIIEMIFDAGGKPVDYRFLEVNRAFGNKRECMKRPESECGSLFRITKSIGSKFMGPLSLRASLDALLMRRSRLWVVGMRSMLFRLAGVKVIRWLFFSMILPSACGWKKNSE